MGQWLTDKKKGETMRQSYEDYLKRKRAEFGSKFDPSDLNPAFIPFFESGQRIEVDFGYEKKRGTIGVTTGWKPVFLLMLTSRSRGSSWVIGKDDKITKVRI